MSPDTLISHHGLIVSWMVRIDDEIGTAAEA
jgi:hypothetical protein